MKPAQSTIQGSDLLTLNRGPGSDESMQNRGALAHLCCFPGEDGLSIRDWSERSMPVTEGILERLVEHMDPDREKRLNGLPIPAFAVGTPVARRPLSTCSQTGSHALSVQDELSESSGCH